MYGSLSCDSCDGRRGDRDLDERHRADQLLRRARSGRSSRALRGCLRTSSAPRSHRRRRRSPATAMNSVVMRPAAVCSPNSRSCVTSCRSSGSISLRISPECSSGRSPSRSAAASGSISSTMSAARSLSSDSTIDTWTSGSISSSASAATSSSIVSNTASRSAGGRSSTMSAMSAGCSFESPS